MEKCLNVATCLRERTGRRLRLNIFTQITGEIPHKEPEKVFIMVIS